MRRHHTTAEQNLRKRLHLCRRKLGRQETLTNDISAKNPPHELGSALSNRLTGRKRQLQAYPYCHESYVVRNTHSSMPASDCYHWLDWRQKISKSILFMMQILFVTYCLNRPPYPAKYNWQGLHSSHCCFLKMFDNRRPLDWKETDIRHIPSALLW